MGFHPTSIQTNSGAGSADGTVEFLKEHQVKSYHLSATPLVMKASLPPLPLCRAFFYIEQTRETEPCLSCLPLCRAFFT